MIILTNDTGAVGLDEAYTLCVRHRDYQAPMPSVVYEDYKPSMLDGKRTMVVVGLWRILTPVNRTQVGKHLLRPIDGVRRVSVDTTLFVVEPWRAWWHFGCVGSRYREYTYSYLAESRWKAAQEGHGEDPFSLEELSKWGDGVVQSYQPRHFDAFEVEVVEVGTEAQRDYQALKARCFDEEHTPAGIIKRLAAFAQQACPRRVVPTVATLFKHRSHAVVATDLGVDRWLAAQLRGLVELTDGLASRFYDGCH